MPNTNNQPQEQNGSDNTLPEQEPEQNGPDNTLPEPVYPCGHLLDGSRSDYMRICVPLYEASMKGDLKAAKEILQNNELLERYSITERYLAGCSITENKETALHIAATTQSIKLVEYLVDVMTNQNQNQDENQDQDQNQNQMLEFQNKQGCTALCLAASAGNVEIAKIMVNRNPQLLTIRGYGGVTPLYLAALYGKRDMVTYLYDKSGKMASNDDWRDADRYRVFLRCIQADFFDVALEILDYNQAKPNALIKDAWEVLDILARKPNALKDIKPHTLQRIINSIIRLKATKESKATQLLRKIWEQIVEKPKDEILDILRGPVTQVEKPKDEILYILRGEPPMILVEKPNGSIQTTILIDQEDKIETYPPHILFTAAEMGNTRFLVELIHKYPDLIWMKNDNGLSIFHVGVSHRHESIFNMLYEIGSMKDLITPLTDPEGNNMLHLVGIMNAETNPIDNNLGAAFQMQRELLWFEEVKAMFSPSEREAKNKAGRTPRQLFIENHKNLVSQGEKWMKGTTSKCMVVAALVATIVFSVAFTIPGGYDQHNGFPIFLQNGPFIAFIIFDAISLISSSTSILIFLSILTSRYAQDDFLKSLPRKLIIGLATLFLSISTMMTAFILSFFTLYRKKLISIPIIMSVFALIPIILYVVLQLPLFLDVYHSTYRSRYLFKPKKRMLYYQNPRC